MDKLTQADERFGHQIPEPFRTVVTHSEHWRESYYFGMHPREAPGDAIILTMAHYPKTATLDSHEFSFVDGERYFAHFTRPYGDDPFASYVGAARVEIVEPYHQLRLTVDGAGAPVGLDVTFTARTQPYLLRRGTMTLDDGATVWDQRHFLQSGSYNGMYTHNGVTRRIDNWWGQRDHSWGIRDHRRCPMWQWLAIQFEDGMYAIWHWEFANGARAYTDGCYAPANRGAPIPVVDFRHDLHWIDRHGAAAEYGRDGGDTDGLAGRVEITLEDGRTVAIEGEGRRCASYGPYGGGQHQLAVRAGDGRTGTAIYELTGVHHHRYFPISRDRLNA